MVKVWYIILLLYGNNLLGSFVKKENTLTSTSSIYGTQEEVVKARLHKKLSEEEQELLQRYQKNRYEKSCTWTAQELACLEQILLRNMYQELLKCHHCVGKHSQYAQVLRAQE